MKILSVGDVHAKVNELDDCNNLMNCVRDSVLKFKPDLIWLSGDLFNDFGIVNLDVALFWEQAFADISFGGKIPIKVSLGNHDFRAGKKISHALRRFNYIEVIENYLITDDFLFLGYEPDNQAFIDKCNIYPDAKALFCHVEIQGAEFENGFYSQHGVDLNLIPQSFVVSGHIHKQAQMGKCLYIGSPRWLTVSDANQDKFIFLIDMDTITGDKKITPIPTDTYCSKIYNFKDYPDNPVKALPGRPHRVVVDLYGPIDYIEKRVEYFKDSGARIRTFPERQLKSEIKESDGINVAFLKHFDNFTPPHGTSEERLNELVHERLGDF
jgi:DNA repair exonuclease SbcCD nuclease subunit